MLVEIMLPLMLPTHENIKQGNNNRSVAEKGEGDKVLELPIEIYRMTQVRWLGTRGLTK